MSVKLMLKSFLQYLVEEHLVGVDIDADDAEPIRDACSEAIVVLDNIPDFNKGILAPARASGLVDNKAKEFLVTYKDWSANRDHFPEAAPWVLRVFSAAINLLLETKRVMQRGPNGSKLHHIIQSLKVAMVEYENVSAHKNKRLKRMRTPTVDAVNLKDLLQRVQQRLKEHIDDSQRTYPGSSHKSYTRSLQKAKVVVDRVVRDLNGTEMVDNTRAGIPTELDFGKISPIYAHDLMRVVWVEITNLPETKVRKWASEELIQINEELKEHSKQYEKELEDATAKDWDENPDKTVILTQREKETLVGMAGSGGGQLDKKLAQSLVQKGLIQWVENKRVKAVTLTARGRVVAADLIAKGY
jgi:hypothetical protein